MVHLIPYFRFLCNYQMYNNLGGSYFRVINLVNSKIKCYNGNYLLITNAVKV